MINQIEEKILRKTGAAGAAVLLVGTLLLAAGYERIPEGFKADNPSGSEALLGQKAPDFSLKDVNGDIVPLSDFRGKAVILNFWATWCAPCRQEIPGFVKLQDRYPDDLVIVGISMDENGDDLVPPFMEEFSMNYPVLYGDENVLGSYGGITGIPTSFVLDRNLIVRQVYIGYRPENVFEQAVEALVAADN